MNTVLFTILGLKKVQEFYEKSSPFDGLQEYVFFDDELQFLPLLGFSCYHGPLNNTLAIQALRELFYLLESSFN